MSDIGAIPPTPVAVPVVQNTPTGVALTNVAVEVISQPTNVAVVVVQNTELVAVEKTILNDVLLTLQTAQGDKLVVKAELPSLANLPLGQPIQLKLSNAALTANIDAPLAQIILPSAVLAKVPLTTLVAPPVSLPQFLPNTSLPPLNNLMVVAQTLPQLLDKLPNLMPLSTTNTDLLTSQESLKNLLQQLQILPQPKMGVMATQLPQLLEQGFASLQKTWQILQGSTPSVPLEVKIQQFLQQQNFGLTTKVVNNFPQLQTSPLSLLAQQPVLNNQQLTVDKPLVANAVGVLQQVLLPGVVDGQALAMPFSKPMLQHLQPLLVLGQITQPVAMSLGVEPKTMLALAPQGFVVLPVQIAANIVPGTILLLESPPAMLKNFYTALVPQVATTLLLTHNVAGLGSLVSTMLALPDVPDVPFTLGAPWDAGNILWQGLEKLGLLQMLPNFTTPSLAQIPSLPLALMQLLGAFKKQDIGHWLGADTVAVLAKTAEGRKLLTTFEQASKAHQQATQEVWRDGWQPLPLPLMHDDKWQVVPLFYRHQDSQQGADDKNEDNGQKKQGGRVTRFLVQMPQTAWGQMQLDGFLQLASKSQEKTQLDMVLRTEQPLAESLNQGLVSRYSQVLGALGYVGQIICQTTPAAKHVMLQPQQAAVEVRG